MILELNEIKLRSNRIKEPSATEPAATTRIILRSPEAWV